MVSSRPYCKIPKIISNVSAYQNLGSWSLTIEMSVLVFPVKTKLEQFVALLIHESSSKVSNFNIDRPLVVQECL